MTKIPSGKTSGTCGHGPLKICFWKEKDDDHDQDFLKKDLLHIWSWSSDRSFSLLLKSSELGHYIFVPVPAGGDFVKTFRPAWPI